MIKNIIVRARLLRKGMTKTEQLLWRELRGRKLHGHRFRKQAPFGQYVVDFVCHESKVIIECDGGQHNEKKFSLYDKNRTAWLESQGYIVHRFWNNEILEQLSAVLEVIQGTCDKRRPPILSFPHKKRGEGTI